MCACCLCRCFVKFEVVLAGVERSFQHGQSVRLTVKLFSCVQQIQSNVCISNRQKWLYAAGGLQASRIKQHALLVLLTLPLLSDLPVWVATNELVMVKDTSCQTPTNHCSIIDGPNLPSPPQPVVCGACDCAVKID